jgi:hypothetical protein
MTFKNCTTIGSGGAIYINNNTVNLMGCVFEGNVAGTGLGNDIFVGGSAPFNSDMFLSACSISKQPTVIIGGTDFSELLNPCVEQGQAWVSLSTFDPPGSDGSQYCFFLFIIAYYCC